MARKTEPVLIIDAQRGVTGGGQGELVNGTTPTVATVPTLTGPTNLEVISNVPAYSAQLPRALVTLRWVPPLGATDVRSYEIAVGTDIGITANVQRFSTDQRQGVLELTTSAAGIQYYAKVRGITASLATDWSSVLGFISAADTTPPPNPTSITASFNDAGDLYIEWINPAATGYRDTEIRIYNDSGRSVLYGTYYSAAGRFYWTAAQNRLAGSGTPDPAVFVVIRGRSWAGVLASTEAFPAVQPTKALPANVTGLTTSWASDTGTAGPDLKITWNAASGATAYRLTLRGVAYRLVANTEYVYTYEQNAIDGAGTASASVSVSIIASDGLGQVSATPATLTAVNAAPAAPSGVVLTAYFATIAITVASVLPADGRAYRYRLIQTSPSAADVTWESPSALQTYSLYAQATYQIGVKIVDAYGQASTETLSSASAVDTLTIGALRADVIYSDADSNSDATLHVKLSDGVLTSGGQTYATSGTWNKWVRAERPNLDRYRTVTLSMTPASGTSTWYLRLSSDGSTWTYYAGPVTSSRILTLVADATAAQAAAVSAGTLGGQTTSRVELPSNVEARFVEVWMRNAGPANTRLDEFYPRRVVEADDIKVQNLSGISADLGTITAGTITGATIQTAASGARIELTSANGLRSYDASNVLQAQIRTSDGQMYFANGDVRLGSYGMRLIVPTFYQYSSAYQFYETTGSTVNAALRSYKTSVANEVNLIANAYNTCQSDISITANSGSSAAATASLVASGNGGSATAQIILTGPSSGSATVVDIIAASTKLTGVLFPSNQASYYLEYTATVQSQASRPGLQTNGNLGASAAVIASDWFRSVGATGWYSQTYGGGIYMQGSTSVEIYGGKQFYAPAGAGIGIDPTVFAGTWRCGIQGATAAAGQYALVVRNSSAANLFYAENNGSLWANAAWTISDENEKTDITDLGQTAHELLDSLRVRRYKRNMSGEYEIGFIAQEMRQTLPEAVREGMGGVLGIRTGDILALLVAARKRDMIIVRNLRQRIIALETRQP